MVGVAFWAVSQEHRIDDTNLPCHKNLCIDTVGVQWRSSIMAYYPYSTTMGVHGMLGMAENDGRDRTGGESGPLYPWRRKHGLRAGDRTHLDGHADKVEPGFH
jgi:hypothetical protein